MTVSSRHPGRDLAAAAIGPELGDDDVGRLGEELLGPLVVRARDQRALDAGLPEERHGLLRRDDAPRVVAVVDVGVDDRQIGGPAGRRRVPSDHEKGNELEHGHHLTGEQGIVPSGIRSGWELPYTSSIDIAIRSKIHAVSGSPPTRLRRRLGAVDRLASLARSWRLVRAALALAVAVPLVVACHLGVLASAQIAASDLLFKTRASQPARNTVIIGIDQRSYQALLPEHGPLSQWPRTLYAHALDALRAPDPAGVVEPPAGPRVVAFGVFFDAARPEDGELAEAIRRAGNVVTPVVAQGARDFDRGPGVAQRFDVFVRPAPAISLAAAGEGLANVTVAPDSVVRGLPLLLRAGGERAALHGPHARRALRAAARRARRRAAAGRRQRRRAIDSRERR